MAEMESALFFRVVSSDANSQPVPIELDYIEDSVTVVPAIQNRIATRRSEKIFEFKVEIWGQLQTGLKVPSEFAQAMQLPIGLLPPANNRIRLELNVGSIVPHDPVEIPGVPHLNPVFGKRAQFGSRSSHHSSLVHQRGNNHMTSVGEPTTKGYQ
jgi:hypothetical protein